MKVVLLTRRSEFQIFAANYLWRKECLSAAIVEEGYSFERGSGWTGALDILKRNSTTILSAVAARPRLFFDYALLQLRKQRYLGNQSFHNDRLLREGYEEFDPGLPLYAVGDINSAQAEERLRGLGPELVLVFGTRLIKPSVFEGTGAPVVNMHWGWSPDYRAEGIVSALAHEGPGALGVTVHLLSQKPDAGDILYQARPTIDSADNFYSIGLKLTLLGLSLFEQVIDDVRSRRPLSGTPQNLSKGRVFGTKLMKSRPDLYHRAWRSLKSGSASATGT